MSDPRPTPIEDAAGHQPWTGINQRARVKGEREVEIAAPPELVWDVLTDFERWPAWNSDVKALSMSGAVVEGTVFRWKAGPGTITSTLRRVEPCHLIAWTGNTLGIRAIHFWRFEPTDHGTTLVRTEESYDGLVARLLRGSMQKALDGALENGVKYLKAEAERRTEERDGLRGRRTAQLAS